MLVTGASSGIGRATALALSREGAIVVAAGRRAERLRTLVEEAPGEMVAMELDVTGPESVDPVVSAVVSRFGRLDALVNNAGLMLAGMILNADTDEWVRMVETNLLGSMRVARAALPHLIESHGTYVQVSSTSGRIATAGNAAYSATKFGITAFAESFRQEATPYGVRTIVVEPGFVTTELTHHITDSVMREAADRIGESMRTLQPEDIAAAVVYALGQPDHVAVNEILVRPTDQLH
ncbi:MULTISPECIES: SDR family oxidoreductase [unclassified Microbacterium]|uniref:SDR family oxidoreductase n=1 Tax=unclassified Microbacterium TaxID=2609290 RepID=UPI001F1132F1|nr:MULTISPECIES: SDR family NAD(P)-dependent oxidoreductase [unclassified Microbacterium]